MSLNQFVRTAAAARSTILHRLHRLGRRGYSSLRIDDTHDLLVVGGGVMGAWTAIAARKRGASVMLADQFLPAHDRGSSHGDGRIYRLAYTEDIYVDMMLRSLPLWHELQDFAGHELLAKTGGLQFAPIGRGRLDAQCETYIRRGIVYERLSAGELNARFPQFKLAEGEDEALYQPELGVLFATKCVAAAWQYAEHLGVAHVTPFRAAAIRRDAGGAGGRVGEVVVEGEDGVALRARSVVFAPGAWLSPLAQALFGLSVPTRVTAETVCYYRPTDASKAAGIDHSFRSMPVFIPEYDNGLGPFGYYGLPMIDVPGIKCSAHYCGPVVHADRRPVAAGGTRTPGLVDGTAEAAAGARVRAVVDSTSRFVAQFFPHVEPEAFLTQSCLYTTTPDHDYIISRVPGQPNVVLAGGGSGHAFKMGPAIGEGAAALALGDQAPPYRMAQFDVQRLLDLGEGAMSHEERAARK